MKLLLIALAVIGLSAAVPTKSLEDDFNDFVELIPVAKIGAIIRKYIDTDAEVQRVLAYLQSEEWLGLIHDVASKQAVQNLRKYLISAGINIDAIIKYLYDLIANTHPNSKASSRIMRQLLDEIEAEIPVADIIALLNDKLSNSPVFVEFLEKLSSEENHKLFEEVRVLPEVQRLIPKLIAMGLDPIGALKVIYRFLGWN